MLSFRLFDALGLVDHGSNDIILVGQLLPEGEKVHQAIAEEANQTHAKSEPSILSLVIYIRF
jgi:hypothetical protein